MKHYFEYRSDYPNASRWSFTKRYYRVGGGLACITVYGASMRQVKVKMKGAAV